MDPTTDPAARVEPVASRRGGRALLGVGVAVVVLALVVVAVVAVAGNDTDELDLSPRFRDEPLYVLPGWLPDGYRLVRMQDGTIDDAEQFSLTEVLYARDATSWGEGDPRIFVQTLPANPHDAITYGEPVPEVGTDARISFAAPEDWPAARRVTSIMVTLPCGRVEIGSAWLDRDVVVGAARSLRCTTVRGAPAAVVDPPTGLRRVGSGRWSGDDVRRSIEGQRWVTIEPIAGAAPSPLGSIATDPHPVLLGRGDVVRRVESRSEPFEVVRGNNGGTVVVRRLAGGTLTVGSNGALSDDDLVRIVQSVRVVDEATYRAAIPGR